MQIIGTGFGRTGTDSMRTALEHLGVGPCHHMRALVDDPAQKADWQRCIDRGEMDWDLLLGGFNSCVDWPSAQFWPELITHFPNAKILLTWRTAESWWRSMEKTIIPSVQKALEKGERSPGMSTLLDGALKGKPMTKANCIAAYEDNVARVKATVPTERLLVFTIGDGWEPLCRFLDVGVPEIPFPRSNNVAEFHKWVDRKNPT